MGISYVVPSDEYQLMHDSLTKIVIRDGYFRFVDSFTDFISYNVYNQWRKNIIRRKLCRGIMCILLHLTD